MNRERHQFNEISIRVVRVLRGRRQRLALFEQRLSQIFKSARNHEPRVGQIEALRNCTRKVERLRHDHFARRMREVERYVAPEHTSMIIRGAPLSR